MSYLFRDVDIKQEDISYGAVQPAEEPARLAGAHRKHRHLTLETISELGHQSTRFLPKFERGKEMGKVAVFPIPIALNAIWTLAVPTLMILALVLVTHGGSWWLRGFAVTAFCLMGHGLFSLLHEAEHDKLHPDRRINYLAGVWLGAFFPASFTILRAAHLTHHARNRSDAELIDYYRPGENRWLKTTKYYAMIGGGLWIGSVVLSILMCFLPSRYYPGHSVTVPGTNATTYLSFMNRADTWRIRREVTFGIALWLALTLLLNLNAAAVASYLIFGFVWSTQQYIFHVRTPLHLVEGSWNLHMWPFFSWLFLNGNYHLTHHRYPKMPWNQLPAVTEGKPQRSYLRTWAHSLLPPRPIADAWPQQFVPKGPLPEGKWSDEMLPPSLP
jgi:fatty acid desaturase